MTVDFRKAAPDAYQGLLAVQAIVDRCGLGPKLLELVKIRTSQLNGCGYCIDLHTKTARSLGETEGRIAALAAWRDHHGFTERERVALEWCEALSLLGDTRALDSAYRHARTAFTDRELAYLSFAIATINAWNRLNVGLDREIEPDQ